MTWPLGDSIMQLTCSRLFQHLKYFTVQLKHHISSSILKSRSLFFSLSLLSCLALCCVGSCQVLLDLCQITWYYMLGPLHCRHQGRFYIFPQISSRIFVTVKFRLFVPGLFCNMFLVVLRTPEPTPPPSRVSSLHFFGTGKFRYVTCL